MTCPTCGMDESPHKCPMAPPHYIQEIDKLKAENTRLRELANLSCWLRSCEESRIGIVLPIPKVFRDLLKPTVELLKYLEDMLTKHPCDGHKEFCICWYCTALRDIQRELSRLEALTK